MQLIAQTPVTNQVNQIAINLIPSLIMLVVMLGIAALICFLLYNLQTAVPHQHRKIEAGLIWLSLIPLFNLIWNFFVFLRVPESYQSAFAERGDPTRGQTERSIGLAYAICAACSIIPCLGLFAALAGLVLLVIFLVKMYNLKSLLQSGGGGGFPVQPPTSTP
jgi:hypothetical protein